MATLAKFLAVFLIVAIILAILLFLFMPRFFYNLNVKDGWKSWTDKRYQLFVFVHKSFRKAMACGQVYERFVDETLRIYNKDNFQKEKSEFDNNKMMNDLVILSEILDDEGFVRKHFCEDSFTYSSYLKMMNEWNKKPIFEQTKIKRPFVWPGNESGTTSRQKLSDEERKEKGSFQKLVTSPERMEFIHSFMTKSLASITDGEEYASLALALKKYEYVQFSSTRELYDCINSSFNPGIKVQYNTVSGMMNRYERNECKEDIQSKMDDAIKRFLKELNEIQP